MERVVNFLKEAETYYLATVEGDQPRVRPFGTAHVFEGKLYIQTGKVKDVSKQIHANPKVEICAFKNGEWLRVAGELVEDDRREARQSMLDAYPSLQNMYSADDGNTEVFYFKNATATFSSFTHEPEVVKFYGKHKMEKSKKKKIYKKIDMVSFYKSIVDQDRASVVICNLKHEIIYMNPAAVISYAKRGGDKLIGRSLLDCHNPESRDRIQQVVDWFAVDESHNIVYTFHNEKQNKDVYMVALRDEGKLIGYYEKHEYRNAETMKQYDLW